VWPPNDLASPVTSNAWSLTALPPSSIA
jgi:hypothetical protein